MRSATVFLAGFFLIMAQPAWAAAKADAVAATPTKAIESVAIAAPAPVKADVVQIAKGDVKKEEAEKEEGKNEEGHGNYITQTPWNAETSVRLHYTKEQHPQKLDEATYAGMASTFKNTQTTMKQLDGLNTELKSATAGINKNIDSTRSDITGLQKELFSQLVAIIGAGFADDKAAHAKALDLLLKLTSQYDEFAKLAEKRHQIVESYFKESLDRAVGMQKLLEIVMKTTEASRVEASDFYKRAAEKFEDTKKAFEKLAAAQEEMFGSGVARIIARVNYQGDRIVGSPDGKESEWGRAVPGAERLSALRAPLDEKALFGGEPVLASKLDAAPALAVDVTAMKALSIEQAVPQGANAYTKPEAGVGEGAMPGFSAAGGPNLVAVRAAQDAILARIDSRADGIIGTPGLAEKRRYGGYEGAERNLARYDVAFRDVAAVMEKALPAESVDYAKGQITDNPFLMTAAGSKPGEAPLLGKEQLRSEHPTLWSLQEGIDGLALNGKRIQGEFIARLDAGFKGEADLVTKHFDTLVGMNKEQNASILAFSEDTARRFGSTWATIEKRDSLFTGLDKAIVTGTEKAVSATGDAKKEILGALDKQQGAITSLVKDTSSKTEALFAPIAKVTDMIAAKYFPVWDKGSASCGSTSGGLTKEERIAVCFAGGLAGGALDVGRLWFDSRKADLSFMDMKQFLGSLEGLSKYCADTFGFQVKEVSERIFKEFFLRPAPPVAQKAEETAPAAGSAPAAQPAAEPIAALAPVHSLIDPCSEIAAKYDSLKTAYTEVDPLCSAGDSGACEKEVLIKSDLNQVGSDLDACRVKAATDAAILKEAKTVYDTMTAPAADAAALTY